MELQNKWPMPHPASHRSTHDRSAINSIADEIAYKLAQMRTVLHATGAAGLRLRGTDWFSWATAGATHTVLLAAETGVAEVLVTDRGAWIVTSEIEASRFADEELADRPTGPAGYELMGDNPECLPIGNTLESNLRDNGPSLPAVWQSPSDSRPSPGWHHWLSLTGSDRNTDYTRYTGNKHGNGMEPQPSGCKNRRHVRASGR